MPWSETTPLKERLRFVHDWGRGLFSFSDLCEHYGISRKTGYKWVERYALEGPAGLVDRSRAPQHCLHETDEAVAQAVVGFRQRHPTWGPRKIVAYLEGHEPGIAWPAPSTVGELLKRVGLVHDRRRRPHPGHPGRPQTPMDAPNAVWTADFKGEFTPALAGGARETRDGQYCYPLTLEDGYSRYLLACRGLLSTKHELAQPVFERVFREYGLPGVMRTDNGTPFATQAICRISRLQVPLALSRDGISRDGTSRDVPRLPCYSTLCIEKPMGYNSRRPRHSLRSAGRV